MRWPRRRDPEAERARAHFAGRRHVRLIVNAGAISDDRESVAGDLTFEGFEVGVWAGWHILERAKLLNEDSTTSELEGGVEIPAGRVVFRLVLAASQPGV